MYCTTHDVKVPFCLPEFSSSKRINHRFHVDNDEDEFDIGYDVIICLDLMVQLSLMADFKRQVLQCDGATLHMKEFRNLRGISNLTKHKILEVVMQNAELSSTQEATERMVKILDITYAKAYPDQLFDAIQMNSEETTLLLRLI